MTTLSVRLPDPLHQMTKQIAEQDHVQPQPTTTAAPDPCSAIVPMV